MPSQEERFKVPKVKMPTFSVPDIPQLPEEERHTAGDPRRQLKADGSQDRRAE
jgi:hypothetical protein